LQIYNTLTHKKQTFKSIKKGTVGMYSCGPTVYNFAHIGNMRTYITTDILKRVLIHNGYKVKHVMNITDVGHLVSQANLGEDKMRLTAEHEHKSVYEIAEFYTEEFLKDMRRLDLMIPETMPKPSDHIKDILSLISVLEDKGYLYRISTGVYFDTSKFKDYGQLMNLSFKELNDYLISGARVERPSGIRNITDFAVWRFVKTEEKDMVWDTKYGKGFPGWHIECSAMSMRYLGEHFDMHTGGVDHLPIHHTNEIAQSESATGKKFVNYWVHAEFLAVNGQKMSKSLGNVYKIQDIVDKGYSTQAYKYLMISAYYRSQLNFTFEALENAQNTLNGMYVFLKKLADAAGSSETGRANKPFIKKAEGLRDEFFRSLNNDLNTPLALSKMHALIGETNKAYAELDAADAKAVLDIILEFDGILALDLTRHTSRKEATDEVKELILKRERLRKERKFADADAIRRTLNEKYGIIIEDTEHGTAWHHANSA
jgi:cysteinyl-tRNA synthetase